MKLLGVPPVVALPARLSGAGRQKGMAAAHPRQQYAARSLPCHGVCRAALSESGEGKMGLVNTKLRGGDLQKRLAGATDAGAVLMLVEENSGEFDATHACTALHRVSKFAAAAGSGGRLPLATDPRLITICSLLVDNFNKLDAQGVSNSLWALAQLGPERRPATEFGRLFELLCGALENDALWAAARPQAVANSAWAYTRLCRETGAAVSDTVLQLLAGRGAACAAAMKPQEVSNLLWALGTSVGGRCVSEADLRALAQTVEVHLRAASAAELSVSVWALAKLGHPIEDEFMEAVLRRLLQDPTGTDAQAAFTALWACTVRGSLLPEALVADYVAAFAGALTASSRTASVTLWACAKLRHDPGPKLVAKALSVLVAAEGGLRPIDLAQGLFGAVQLGYSPGAATAASLLGSVEALLDELNPQQLTMISYALARMETPLGEELAGRILRRGQEAAADGFEREGASVSKSMAKLGFIP